MNKFVGLVIGLLLGLAVSYLFKPQVLFGTLTPEWWFSEGLKDKATAPTIYICAVVGATLGFFAGLLLDRKPISNPTRNETP